MVNNNERPVEDKGPNPAMEQWGDAEISWGGIEEPRDPNSWKGTEGLPAVGSEWNGMIVTEIGGVELDEGGADTGEDLSDIDPAEQAYQEYQRNLSKDSEN